MVSVDITKRKRYAPLAVSGQGLRLPPEICIMPPNAKRAEPQGSALHRSGDLVLVLRGSPPDLDWLGVPFRVVAHRN